MAATTLNSSPPKPRSPHNPRIYFLTFLSCLGSWMFGYNNGVIAGVLVLPSFYRDFNLPPVGTKAYNNVTGNIVSLLQVGGLVGSLGTFGVMKYSGRRGAMIVAGAVYLVGAVMQVCIFLLCSEGSGGLASVCANKDRHSVMVNYH